MKRWLLSEIRAKIEADLDLEDEDFIQPEELVGYVNEGIDTCEALIHTLYEDYFLVSGNITLVNGTSAYDLPADIYADKVRGIEYINGSKIYQVKRIREADRFHTISLINTSAGVFDYAYYITNPAAGPKINLVPTSYEAGALLNIWYLRNAAELVNDTDECDIPEFAQFVIQFAKVKCLEKEGNPMLSEAVALLDNYRKLMIDTLSTMSPDGDNTIEADNSHYEEMS